MLLRLRRAADGVGDGGGPARTRGGPTGRWAQLLGDADPLWLIGIPALAVGLTAWLLRGVGDAQNLSGADTLAHLVRTEFGMREVFGRGHLDGWSPTPGVGSELFLFYGPGLAMLTLAARVASLGLLSTAGAFKAVVIISFLAMPLALAYLARGFGLSLRASALAGVLGLAVSSAYGPGIEGTFAAGLVPHQVAAPIVLLGLGVLVRTAFDPQLSRLVPLALCLAAMVIVHPISAVIFLAFGGVVLALAASIGAVVSRRAAPGPRQLTLPGLGYSGEPAVATEMPPRSRDAILVIAGAGVMAVVLSAFWVVPFLAHRDLQGLVSGWVTPSFGTRLGEVLDGRLLFRPLVPLFVLAGMVGVLALQRDRRTLTLVLAPFVYLFVAHLAVRNQPFNEIAFQLPNRGLGYAGLVAVIPLALVIDRLTLRMGRELGDALAVAVVVAVGVWPMLPLAARAYAYVPRPAMVEAAAEIRRVVPESGRFAVERQIHEHRDTGVGTPPFWLAVASGRQVVNAFAPETSTAPRSMYVGDEMTQIDPGPAADRLVRFGVTHAFLTSEAAAARFRESPRFAEVWSSPPLSLFEVRAPADRPPPSSLVSTDGVADARLTGGDPEHLRIRVDAPAPVTAALAVAWSPKWRARVDGRPAAVRPAADGLVELSVPAGSHTVALDFSRDRWDAAGAVVTATALGAGAAVLWRRRRQRRRPPGVLAPENGQDVA